MSKPASVKPEDMPADDDVRKKEPSAWDVRNALGSLETMRKYDAYLAEHKRRLRQLEKEAGGEMSPSGEWYRE